MKNSILLLVVALVFVSQAGAQTEMRQPRVRQGAVIAALGASTVIQYESNGRELGVRGAYSVRGGYSFRLADMYFEYLGSRRSTGAGVVNVTSTRSEYLLWGKYVFLKSWKVRPFIAAGAGMGYDMVDTHLYDESQAHAGALEPVGALVGGWQWRFWKMELNSEARVTAAESYNPNPTLSLGVFLGGRF